MKFRSEFFIRCLRGGFPVFCAHLNIDYIHVILTVNYYQNLVALLVITRLIKSYPALFKIQVIP